MVGEGKSKVVLGEQTFSANTGGCEFGGGGEIIGTRESFSNKLHSKRGRSLQSVEDISRCRLNRMKRKQR